MILIYDLHDLCVGGVPSKLVRRKSLLSTVSRSMPSEYIREDVFRELLKAKEPFIPYESISKPGSAQFHVHFLKDWVATSVPSWAVTLCDDPEGWGYFADYFEERPAAKMEQPGLEFYGDAIPAFLARFGRMAHRWIPLNRFPLYRDRMWQWGDDRDPEWSQCPADPAPLPDDSLWRLIWATDALL